MTTIRTARLIALPLTACVGMLAFTGVASQGAPTAPAAHASAGHATHADQVAKKKKKKHTRIKNKKLGIPKPSGLSGPGAGQAALTWPKTKGANRYSVLWSSGPYGKWPGPTTYVGPKWLPSSARSAVLDVTGLGGYQLSLPYGNPAFMSLWADNSRDRAPRHKAKYLAVWPQIAAPGSGPHVRVGQYNIDGGNYSDARGEALASNIRGQGLSLVAMQEASGSNAGANVALKLKGWGYLGTGVGTGDEGIAFGPGVTCNNPRVVGPHALAATCFVGRNVFTFVSAHYLGSNADTGAQAAATLPNLGNGTAIVAGDFTSNREPYGSANQAQPVFVGNGFWDAQASLNRDGVQYSTYNGRAPARVNASGYGTRADYIMLRGIPGSYIYRNVANGAGNPSDHNLVWAEVAIP